MPSPDAVVSPRLRFDRARTSSARQARAGRGRARRMRRWPFWLAAGAVVFVWAVAASVIAVGAGRDLRTAKHAADAARLLTSPDDFDQGRPIAPLRQSAAAFRKAQDLLDGPVVFPLRVLPVVGRQLASARALARSGGEATGSIGDALDHLHQVAHQPLAIAAARLDLLHAFASVGATEERQLQHAGAHLGPAKALLTPLADARTKLADQINTTAAAIGRGVIVAQAMERILGPNHRLLVLATNNAEMRNGSGMALQAGTLETLGGHLHLDGMQAVSTIPVARDAVPATGAMAGLWGWLNPTTNWEELLASARFDETAPLAAKMWASGGRAAVDGVLVVDPVALQAVLAVSGPVVVDGRQINETNVLQEILHDQYLRFPAAGDSTARRDELATLTQAAFDKLEAGGWSPARLALRLAEASRGRHVLLWSSAPADEQAWTSAGIAGSLAPNSMMVSLLNRSRDKADFFVAGAARLTLTSSGDHTEAEVTVTIDNGAPTGQPALVSGPGIGVQSVVPPGTVVTNGDYVAVLAVTLPGAATNVTIDGLAAATVYGADGATFVVGNQYLIHRGEQRKVGIRFRLAVTSGELLVLPSARVPPFPWATGTAKWTGDEVQVVRW